MNPSYRTHSIKRERRVSIVLIHQAFVSPHEAGGTRHFELARRLVAGDHDFTIVASQLNFLTGQRTAGTRGFVSTERLDGVRILRAYTFPALHRSYVWRVVSFLSFTASSLWAALRAGPVDLVMGTSPPIFQAVSAWLVAVVRRRPLLLEIRDLWPEFAIDIGVLKNRVLIWLARRLEGFLLARATHIVVNSPAYRDYLLAKGVSETKISFIANGVDCAMFTAQSVESSVRRQFGLDGKFVATYAGALGMANDIDTILEAARRLRDDRKIHFLIVGDGKERHRLQSLAEAEGLTNVTFAGPRPKSEMPAILAASDACLATLKDIPMFRTTYPNKVFDYMAAGRPTILGIDGVVRDVLEAASGGIPVPPGNAAALADALRYLAQNPVHARDMGASARQYVRRHFDREQQATELANLIDRLSFERAA